MIFWPGRSGGTDPHQQGEFVDKESRVFVAGHRGLVGSALVRRLRARGMKNLLLRTHGELDLADHAAVDRFFKKHQPQHVFLAAAKVGGIHANSAYPADFIRDNLLIGTNVIDAAFRHGAVRLLFLGSSCIYPRLAPQPIREQDLLTGPLEPTNEWYAVAKIAGLKLCQALRLQHGFDAVSLMPTNLYGPGDNFHPRDSHVIPGLMRRFHEARTAGAEAVEIWGTGTPKREFLHVDDLADACCHVMDHEIRHDVVNVGSGQEVTIRELAELVMKVVGYDGKLRFTRPEMDGTPRKLLEGSRLAAMGWRPRRSLEEGLAETYDWFVKNVAETPERA